MNETTALLLSFRQVLTIIHALTVLKEKESQRNSDDLLSRLHCTIREEIKGVQFSEQEIRDVTDALNLALVESRRAQAERYGYLTLDALEKLLGEVKNH